jgi:hypothetical protein
MTRPEYTEVLNEVALLIAERDFRGLHWLTELSAPLWEYGTGHEDWFELYGGVEGFLFDVGLVGVIPPTGNQEPVYAIDDETFGRRSEHLVEGARFVVHPAYRKALAVREV